MALDPKQLAEKTPKELASLMAVVGPTSQHQIRKEVKRRATLSSKNAARVRTEAEARWVGRNGPRGDGNDLRGILGFIGNSSSSALVLTIPGEPKPKERPRFGRGRAYSSKSQKEDEARLRDAMEGVLGGADPYHGTVAVACIFYRATQHRVDVDNLLKQVMDAARGILWHDDDQVTAKVGVLEIDRKNPRVAIGVTPYSCSVKRVQK